METGAAEADRSNPSSLDRWSARKIQPIVLLYVTAVFAFFMAVAHFVFHSDDAVKALLIGAVGTIAATMPGVMEMVEYRLTDAGLDKRPHRSKEPRAFQDVFRWEELSHIVPMRHGFKYFKSLNETNQLRRFWKVHISDRYAGEVHVERNDLDRVLRTIAHRGGPSQPGR